jgi:hypothetical protein
VIRRTFDALTLLSLLAAMLIGGLAWGIWPIGPQQGVIIAARRKAALVRRGGDFVTLGFFVNWPLEPGIHAFRGMGPWVVANPPGPGYLKHRFRRQQVAVAVDPSWTRPILAGPYAERFTPMLGYWRLDVRLGEFVWLFSVLPAVWMSRQAARGVRALAARQRSRKGLCPACGYDLRASKERCPECGTPVPTSPSSFNAPNQSPA